MGFLDDLQKIVDSANKVMNKSLYDPPRLEVDGIVHETDIPEDMEGWENPGELAYPHNDFARDPGVEEHVIDGENAFEPGGELPSVREDKRTFESGAPENPDFSMDAAANLMPVAQYTIGTNAFKVVDTNFRRTSILIQNLSNTNTISLGPNTGAAPTGIVVAPNQSVELPYCGDLYAIATAATTIISVAEFIRMPV